MNKKNKVKSEKSRRKLAESIGISGTFKIISVKQGLRIIIGAQVNSSKSKKESIAKLVSSMSALIPEGSYQVVKWSGGAVTFD